MTAGSFAIWFANTVLESCWKARLIAQQIDRQAHNLKVVGSNPTPATK